MIRSRYRRIILFSARTILGFIYWDLFLPRIGLRERSQRTRVERIRRSAVAFRKLAIQMGGVLIKVGQFLSTRVDVLPKEFTDELRGLQDEVPAEQFKDIRRIAEAEYGCRLEQKFEYFNPHPLAAASLGQVHEARLHPEAALQASNGCQVTDVVVKIQRPNIEQIIATDLAALQTVGKWLHRYPPIRRRANVPELIKEFSRILSEEVDYIAEGHNAELFAKNFNDDPGIRVPCVVWSHTTRRALTLENVLAIKIADYEAITRAGVSRTEVASRLLDTYLKQILEDGFFHADPHPGNLFIYLPEQQPNAEGKAQGLDWQLTFVDFGMVGHLPPNTRSGMRELLIGVGTQDAARVVKSYQMLGLLLPGADLQLIERAQASVFERFWGLNMTELTQMSTDDIREFTNEFRELLYTMPFQIPQDFIFLARAVGILSGMCTGLDPRFNVWDHISPFARKLIAEEAWSNREAWFSELLTMLRLLAGLPGRIDSVLTRVDRGEISVRNPDLELRMTRLESTFQQAVHAILFTAFLLSAVQLYLANQWYLALPLALGAIIALIASRSKGNGSRH
jgi:predicted unusual protein kinase regulating ubiquinone biosynthesis (AarF/ABC1/UbiB family)